MNAGELFAALDLPGTASVGRRVPKTLLTEHGAPTAADKRRIAEGIERFDWMASIKATTIGVDVYMDDVREYLEIAVLHLVLRRCAKAPRLIELVHRAVPYPLLLITEEAGQAGLSAAHKRWSKGKGGTTVLDGNVVRVEATNSSANAHQAEYLAALALGRQPQRSLFTVYQGWTDVLHAVQASSHTGRFAVPDSTGGALSRREALRTFERLEAEAASLRSAAAKEKQLPRRVELNLELRRVEAARAHVLSKL